ncbi:filament integrity protein fraC [Aetokthonos hydrillicola Thurmond2011]|jgi:hypothetical protein|uniref:Filament integrity protein fraC n=1 Tax=Aetokthonos hydrillicola Thurmond2011 TaxID=2712845 RepID=A0AAP5M9V2_9CYAN|nr:filament integrity protein FraC [Aetokthonos hydrillicola]MBO3458747.1 filament integrity protein fraC [Aetokthonos hydrillicola CCALA 1050]MBW4585495.1 filament integrity protein fraC [Aetokthonos hydrillicola CCALA 1050]MDR9896117.1 filament integrity protein fraC [Aetokthonos hydrillicola Thurmond2011]
MIDYPFLPRVFPLGVILFDFLFLLVAIAIEAYILQRRLNFDRRTSSFYAIAINVFSSVIGWIIFFFVEPMLPVRFKAELVDYIFFNQLRYANHIQSIIVLTAFIIFFATFLVKYILMKVMLISLSDPSKNKPQTEIIKRRNSRRNNKFKWQNSNLVTSLLIANSLSYTVIVIIVFIRSAYV